MLDNRIDLRGLFESPLAARCPALYGAWLLAVLGPARPRGSELLAAVGGSIQHDSNPANSSLAHCRLNTLLRFLFPYVENLVAKLAEGDTL